jgi:hypothetical protein
MIDVAELRRQAAAGWMPIRIAAAHGVRVPAVYRACHRLGIPINQEAARVRAAREARILELHAQGLNRSAIARETCSGWKTVDAVIASAGRAEAGDAAPARPTTMRCPAAPPTLPPHPWWSPERDAAVVCSGGAMAGLSALATEWRKPAAFVFQRWHRLRAGA